MKLIKKYLNKFLHILIFRLKYKNNIEYWEERVNKYGDNAVFNIENMDQEEQVLKKQLLEIFPLIEENLTGAEKIILDYGCGYGRFTKILATLIDGKAIGVDPIQKLLKKDTYNVQYLLLKENRIPLNKNSVDIVFICLVLGGIENKNLKFVKSEIERVLKINGLIILIEKTVDKTNFFEISWKGRTSNFYEKLFKEFNLQYQKCYYDCNEKIGIFIGHNL